MTRTPAARIAAIKKAVADLITAEGCSCCRDSDGHAAAKAQLGKLLRFPKYSDGSGYDFTSKKRKR